MASNRANQTSIDQGQAGITERQILNDPHQAETEKQRVAETKHRDQASMIPQRGKNPALADLQARRAAKEGPSPE